MSLISLSWFLEMSDLDRMGSSGLVMGSSWLFFGAASCLGSFSLMLQVSTWKSLTGSEADFFWDSESKSKSPLANISKPVRRGFLSKDLSRVISANFLSISASIPARLSSLGSAASSASVLDWKISVKGPVGISAVSLGYPSASPTSGSVT
jgi:hypothetical protein